MGHKTLSVTVNYAHASPEAMRWAAERLRELSAQVVEFQADQELHDLAISAADVTDRNNA